MGKAVAEPRPEVERARAWCRQMIADLGPDLRQCIEWVFDAEDGALDVVIACMRRCGVPLAVEIGVTLYWRELLLAKEKDQQPGRKR